MIATSVRSKVAPLVGCIDGKLLYRVQILDDEFRRFLHYEASNSTWIYIDRRWYKDGLSHTLDTTDPEGFGHTREKL